MNNFKILKSVDEENHACIIYTIKTDNEDFSTFLAQRLDAYLRAESPRDWSQDNIVITDAKCEVVIDIYTDELKDDIPGFLEDCESLSETVAILEYQYGPFPGKK